MPIRTYLSEHPRPDLVEVSRRMSWLGEGLYGDRAGDILLIGKASMSLPIQERYYSSYVTYFAWHGSVTLQDSHIPLIVAKSAASGEQLKGIVDQVVRDPGYYKRSPAVSAGEEMSGITGFGTWRGQLH